MDELIILQIGLSQCQFKFFFKSYLLSILQVGGLGDVVTGLGKALQKRGHLVEVVLPKYDCMQYDHIRDLRVCFLFDTTIEESGFYECSSG